MTIRPSSQQDELRVRRNIHALSPDGPEIAALRRGVAEMQRRDRRDPTSWLYQANIHGTLETDNLPAWNTCQHGSFFFLPWHRMYIYWFERILRAASGDPSLTLPYWDYLSTAHTALPRAFREPQDASNPLYIRERNPLINRGYRFPVTITNFAPALRFDNFSSPPGSVMSFGGAADMPKHYGRPHGQLEAQHDCVHVSLGLTRLGFMQNPNFAARDPIFWVHHTNVDRLWSRWLDQSGNDPSMGAGEAFWYDTSFLFFDENGREVRMTPADVLDTARQLGYCYDDDPPPLPRVRLAGGTPEVPVRPVGRRAAAVGMAAVEAPRAVVSRSLGRSPSGVVLGGSPTGVTVPLTVEAPAAPAVARVVGRKGAVAAPPLAPVQVYPRRYILNIETVDFKDYPSNVYEVYVNLPAGVPPSYRSRYYAGALAFFAQVPSSAGHAHPSPDKPGTPGTPDTASQLFRSFDITANVIALREHGEWEGEARVDFFPTQLLRPAEHEEPMLAMAGRAEAGVAEAADLRALEEATAEAAAVEPVRIGAVTITTEDVLREPTAAPATIATPAQGAAKAPAIPAQAAPSRQKANRRRSA